MNANEAIAYIHSVFREGSIPGLSKTRDLKEETVLPLISSTVSAYLCVFIAF